MAFNLAFSLYLNTGAVIANPGTYTKKIWKDGGAAADIAGAVTETDATYGQLVVQLSASEMNADYVQVKIYDDTAGCVPFCAVIYPAAGNAYAEAALVHAHVATIDGHITADYGATEKTCIDLLDDAAGGLADIHTDVAAVKSETALIVADTAELQAEWVDGGRLDLILDGIGTSVVESAPSSVEATANTLSRGTAIQVDGTSTGGTASTYAATFLDDASYLAFAPLNSTAAQDNLAAVSGFMQMVFSCGTKRANQVVVNAAMTGNGRWCNIYAWNYVTAGWDLMTDSVTRIIGTASPVDKNYTVTLLEAHQKNLTAGDGEVKLGFGTPSTTTSDRIRLDQVLVKAMASGATAASIADAVWVAGRYTKYDGHVWIDTVHGADGTDLGVNGLPTNPVKTHADAMTLAAALPTHRLAIATASDLTLTSDTKGHDVSGHGYKLALAGFDLSYTHIDGCELLTGVATSADWEMFLWNCQLGACTLGEVDAHNCHITDLVTLGAAAPYLFSGCTGVPTGTPGIDFGTAVGASTVVMSNFAGVGTIKYMKAGDVLYVDGNCQLTLDATCVAGTVYVAGDVKLTNASSITASDIHVSTVAAIEAALPTTSYRFLIKV